MQQNEEHELIKIKISDVKLDKTNPNQMSKDQMAGLRQSMERWGYLTPIILDQDNNICDGEHRLLVYKQLGRTEIPAYRLHLESDAERRMIRQVMNKLHGIHDKQLDADELATLFENNKLDDLSKLIAAQKEDLERLILRYHPSLDFRHPEDPGELDKLIDDEMKKIAPDAQLGDIYQLGRHRLICADCTDKRAMDRLLEDTTIAQLNTDPPYGVNYSSKNDFFKDVKKGQNHIKEGYDNDAIDFDYRAMFNNIFPNIRWTDYNTFYIWSSGAHLHDIRMAIMDSDLTWGDYLVWIKNQSVLGRKDYNAQHEFCIYGWFGKHKFYSNVPRTTVLNYNKPHLNELHPTMKPVELIKQTITDGSKENDAVLDVFAGSGTALMACEQSNRSCYAIELDPHYCDIIIKRWEGYTGQKAQKLT